MPKNSLLKLSVPFVLGFLLLAVVGLVFSELLMGVSSFMHGENLWAKNQKTAVVQLQRYLATADPDALARHDSAMRVHRVFRTARELMDADPDEIVQKMAQCDLSPVSRADCTPIFMVHRYFHKSPMVVSLMGLWAEGDRAMNELAKVRAQIDVALARGKAPAHAYPELIDVIYRLELQADGAEREFSAELNDLRYWVFGILLSASALLAIVLLALIVFRTQRYGMGSTGVCSRAPVNLWMACTLGSSKA